MLLIFYLNWFSFAFCAARDLYVSLEDFLRDLPTPDYNVSQLLENSTAFQDNADPQLGWTGNPPLPANEELWCKSVSKGTTLMNAMTYTDEDAGQTFSPPRDTARSDYNYGKCLIPTELKNYKIPTAECRGSSTVGLLLVSRHGQRVV